MSIHPAVKSLSWLIGTWLGKNGAGIYPTINSFAYNERLEVLHPAPNQPVLHLRFTSWFENPETKEITHAHFEYGFLKVKPNSSPAVLVYTSSHNNGLSIVEEGSYDETNKVVTLESSSVGRTSINKPPAVLKTKRVLTFVDDSSFDSELFMSTSTNQSLDKHLSIKYKKEI